MAFKILGLFKVVFKSEKLSQLHFACNAYDFANYFWFSSRAKWKLALAQKDLDNFSTFNIPQISTEKLDPSRF